MGVNMIITKRGSILTTLLAVLLLTIVSCESESPTAPTPGGGGGGNTPPTGATVTLTVSNPNPLVSSTSTITATVMNGSTPVPNGTAVEFSTNFGTFTDTAASTTIRTTTDGVATAVLTSSAAGTATVTARVNNVTRTANVVFRTDTGGGTQFTVTSFSPARSGPSGGQVVTIRGTNFANPVRVLFGDQNATVISVGPTEIQAVVPAINLGATEQAREVTITVINQAGTSAEKSATASTPFRYEIEILTPVVYNVSPSSGPNEGNTRITIIGEGFQAPTRVYFGSGGSAGGSLTDQVELDVVQVTFGQIIAMTPPALGLGVELKDRQVSMRILNVNTNKDVVVPNAFRYGPGMAITAVGPTTGSFLGGTKVTINGWGFDDPVAVSIGGFAAQPIRVSGTEIVAITSAIPVENCAPAGGSSGSGISVTNIEDGNSAEAQGITFEYLIPQPRIISISPPNPVAGGTVTVTVANAGPGGGIISIGDANVFTGPPTFDGSGNAVFTITVPTELEFQTQSCGAGGERDIATRFTIGFENLLTGCDTEINNGLVVTPPPLPRAEVRPAAITFTTTVGTPTTQTFSIINTGTAPLTVNSATAAPNPPFAAGFVGPVTLQPCASVVASVSYTPTAAGTNTGSVIIATDANNAVVALTGTATVPAP
jgi:hypothetical protein